MLQKNLKLDLDGKRAKIKYVTVIIFLNIVCTLEGVHDIYLGIKCAEFTVTLTAQDVGKSTVNQSFNQSKKVNILNIITYYISKFPVMLTHL